MKKIKLICFFVFAWNLYSCKAIQGPKLCLLKIKDVSINKILEDFVKEENSYSDVDKSIIIIRIEESNNNKEIRIGALYKEVLELYLLDKKDKSIGYFDYNGVTVIVFGKTENSFFEKTDIEKEIFLNKTKHKLKERKTEVPPPPLIFEPIIRIYLYKEGNFELTHKGRFALLS